MSETDEIKSKLDIVEVIREYVPVKAAGASFQALCPFHNEKTPSFTISPEKQVWHCFGCGRGGDVFSFVMEKESLNFPEALRLLAKKAGVTLKNENRESYSERNRLLDIMELAGRYYAHIFSTDSGQEFRKYLLDRGLTEETISDWQIGCSQDSWDSLYKFLKARPIEGQKFTDEEIFAAGLTVKKNQAPGSSRGYYDRFRDRIMFPIWDASNNLIAFTARVNPAKEKTEKLGKYINSPQTRIYDKSRVLFGLNKAKTAIREADLAIVVEGQMDVISCHQHGFKNVVASSGTALTAEQVSLLKRFTENVALLFDMDQAGQLAADRGIREVLAQEMNLKVIILASGKDPAEALRHDPEEFQVAVAAAKPMLEYYFTKITAGLDLEQMDNKRVVSQKMFAMIDLVVNKTEQGFWLKKMSEALGFFEPDTREEFVKWRAKNSVLKNDGRQSGASRETAALPKMSREDKLAERLLALLVRFPEFVNYASNNLEPEDVSASVLAGFYKNLIIYYNKAASLDYDAFRAQLGGGGEEQRLLDKLVLLGEKDFYDFEGDQAKAELISIIFELKKYDKKKLILKLQRAIAQAEKEGRMDELAGLMNDLKNLTAG